MADISREVFTNVIAKMKGDYDKRKMASEKAMRQSVIIGNLELAQKAERDVAHTEAEVEAFTRFVTTLQEELASASIPASF